MQTYFIKKAFSCSLTPSIVFPDHMGAKCRYNLTTTSEKEVATVGAGEPTEDAGELGATIFVMDLCFFL